jgi:YaiO family outer membrane protein
MKILPIAIAFIILVTRAHGQTPVDSTQTEFRFQLAREKAFDGERTAAIQLLRGLTKTDSTNSDVRLFLARVYGWEASYDLAKQEINIVLKADAHHEEAIALLLDIAIWSHEFNWGLQEVEKALSQKPTSIPLLLRKARLQNNLNEYEQANQTIKILLTIDSQNEEAMQLKSQLKAKLYRYEISATVSTAHFSQTFSPAYYWSTQLTRYNRWGTLSGRVNYASRFNNRGVQPELELYPRFSRRIYAYLNYGYSESILFPRNRMGAELFSRLWKNLEGSFGLRYMDFRNMSSVYMYTGSLSWYKEKYWIMARPTLVATRDLMTYATAVTVRRYFKDESSYVNLILSTGLLPDERRLQSGVGVSLDKMYALKSNSITLGLNKVLRNHSSVRLSIDATYREKSAGLNQYLWINSCQVALARKF